MLEAASFVISVSCPIAFDQVRSLTSAHLWGSADQNAADRKTRKYPHADAKTTSELRSRPVMNAASAVAPSRVG